LRRELGLEKNFVVSYIGTMGMAHGLDTMLAAAARLKNTNREVSFLFVGEGADKERIIKQVQQQRLTNVHFVDQQPREKIPAYINASDACLVLLRKTDLFKTVIPTKMLEFMSCARPVILGVDGQAREILERSRGGIVIEPENVEALISSILTLAANQAMANECGRNGREYIIQEFSRRRLAEKYIYELQKLLKLDPSGETELAA
jgi:glycosyltransferase involved in cell wall biosynthesis